MSASDKQYGGEHYAKLPKDMQPWNVLKHWLTPEEYRGWQKGVAIVYLARERDKGGDTDIRKAMHHLERLIEEFDGDATMSASILRAVAPIVEAQKAYERDQEAAAALQQAATAPDSDGWIPWNGGECPVAPLSLVKIRFRDGECDDNGCRIAGHLRWEHIDTPSDIVAFKVVE